MFHVEWIKEFERKLNTKGGLTYHDLAQDVKIEVKYIQEKCYQSIKMHFKNLITKYFMLNFNIFSVLGNDADAPDEGELHVRKVVCSRQFWFGQGHGAADVPNDLQHRTFEHSQPEWQINRR